MSVYQIVVELPTLPPAGKYGIQVEDDFVAAQEAFQDKLTNEYQQSLNVFKKQANLLANDVNNKSLQVSTDKNASALSATSASTSKEAAKLAATQAIAAKNDITGASEEVLALSGIDFGSFSVANGELIVGYFDPTASIPSIVDGEFIITY